MKTLVRHSSFVPSFRSMMEDLWNGDTFFNFPLPSRLEMPAVNVRETKAGFELEVAAPGFKKEDFKVTADNHMLTISAENRTEKKEEQEDYMRQEFSCSAFTRTFTLPENVTEDHVNAAYQDGILKINLKKNGKTLPAAKEIKIS